MTANYYTVQTHKADLVPSKEQCLIRKSDSKTILLTNIVLVTYLHYRVATVQRLHRPSAAFGLIVGPVVRLWLHLDL